MGIEAVKENDERRALLDFYSQPSERSYHGLSTSDPPLHVQPPIHLVRSYLSQTTLVSNAALEYYNAKHRTKYVLVNPIHSDGNPWIGGGIWYHCNFKAKVETSSETSDGGHGDSSTKLFFGELKVNRKDSGKEYLVTTCCPLVDDTKTTKQCEMCTEDVILHPTGRFHQGCHQFKPPALRPRRNGKVFRRSIPLGPLQS